MIITVTRGRVLRKSFCGVGSRASVTRPGRDRWTSSSALALASGKRSASRWCAGCSGTRSARLGVTRTACPTSSSPPPRPAPTRCATAGPAHPLPGRGQPIADGRCVPRQSTDGRGLAAIPQRTRRRDRERPRHPHHAAVVDEIGLADITPWPSPAAGSHHAGAASTTSTLRSGARPAAPGRAGQAHRDRPEPPLATAAAPARPTPADPVTAVRLPAAGSLVDAADLCADQCRSSTHCAARVGVVTFPGTLDDQDAARAVRLRGSRGRAALARGPRPARAWTRSSCPAGSPTATTCAAARSPGSRP